MGLPDWIAEKKVSIGVVVFCVGVLFAGWLEYDALKDDNKELRRDNETLKGEILALQANNSLIHEELIEFKYLYYKQH